MRKLLLAIPSVTLTSAIVLACASEATTAGSSVTLPAAATTDAGATAADSGPAITSTSTSTDAAAPLYAIGGTASGLKGTGLVLQTAAGEELAVTADGAFAFPTKLGTGASFAVTVKTQPSGPPQTCAVSGGTGVVGAADVASIAVVCATDKFTVGGTVTGLLGTAVLANGADEVTVSANGTFAFPIAGEPGTSYAVTVKSQPMTPSQTCTLAEATGAIATANVTSVALTCVTNTFTVGGTVTGLAGSGLVLTDNGADDLAATAGPFTFATKVASGQPYAVAVKTQPTKPSQTCAVTPANGTMGGAAVTDVAVTCTTNVYPVRVTVSGLAGTLVLQNSGGDDLTLTANGTQAFATSVASGSTYAVKVKTQPNGKVCTVSGASGTIVDAAVDVTVTCVNGTLYGPTHTFANQTSNHYITQGACSIQKGGDQGDADYFCQHFYSNTACTAQSFTPGRTPTPTTMKMHKYGGCTSNGTNIPGTTCDSGPCKIGNWTESTQGLNDIVCFCPAP